MGNSRDAGGPAAGTASSIRRTGLGFEDGRSSDVSRKGTRRKPFCFSILERRFEADRSTRWGAGGRFALHDRGTSHEKLRGRRVPSGLGKEGGAEKKRSVPLGQRCDDRRDRIVRKGSGGRRVGTKSSVRIV